MSHFRKATLYHAYSLSLLHKQAFKKGWSCQDFISYLKNPAIKGYMFYGSHAPLAFILYQEIDDEVDIITLAVDKNFRGLGIGKLFFKKTLNAFKKKQIKKIFLDVDSKNKYALKLYEKIGFKKLHLRKKYYHNISSSGDALVLYKSL